jgi:hypothetical protein
MASTKTTITVVGVVGMCRREWRVLHCPCNLKMCQDSNPCPRVIMMQELWRKKMIVETHVWCFVCPSCALLQTPKQSSVTQS